jgi:hypothetical protein
MKDFDGKTIQPTNKKFQSFALSQIGKIQNYRRETFL